MISLIYSTLLCHVVMISSKSMDLNTTETELQNPIDINSTEVSITKDINATDTKDLELQIEALEKQKDDLFNKINVAIDETVKALEHANDSDSIDGRQYLMELKKQMKELDEADSDEDSEERNATSTNGTDAEFRRFGRVKQNKEVHDPKNYIAERIRFKKRGKKATAFMQTLQHLKVERDVRDWIHMKNEEKRKIREYRMKRKQSEFFYETCPREGEKKKKKNRDRPRKRRGKNKNRPENRFRPCCRKCCKRSYLGCL